MRDAPPHDPPPPPQRPFTRAEVAGWLLLGLFVVLSRALVAPDVLAEWDSANYVHGWQSFDAYEHAPHIPGYPLFVLALGALSLLPGTVTTPFVLLNIALSLALLALLGWIARAEVGRAVALVLAASFAVCPAFWYHGALSTAYVAECFCSVLVGASAWALARRRLGVVAAGAMLAVAGGLRPTTLVYLSPLMALALLLSRRPPRAWLAFAAAAGTGVLLWLVPTVVAAGGWGRYRTAMRALAQWQSDTHSVLSGSWSEALRNFSHLTMYLWDSLHLVAVLLVALALLAAARRRWGGPWPLLIAAWCLPAATMYTLHHLPKAGYVLTILPALYLAAALAFPAATRGLGRRGLAVVRGLAAVTVGLAIAVNVAAFALSVPAEALGQDDPGIPDGAIVITGDYGWRGMRWRTEPQRHTRDLVERLGGEDTVALYLWGTQQLQRIESVYHPDQWMLASALDHGCIWSNRDDSDRFCGSFGDFQVRILYAPEGGLTHRRVTALAMHGDLLTVRRGRRHVTVPLRPRPSRLLVFVPCPPCVLSIGAGLARTRAVDVDARTRLLVLDVLGDSGEDHSSTEANGEDP